MSSNPVTPLQEQAPQEVAPSNPLSKSYRGRYVSLRAVLLAIVLAILNDYWVVQLEVVRYSFATYAAPFYNVVFTLFVLTIGNFLVRRRFPRIALTHTELMTVYVMLSITTAVCSHHMLEILVSLMGHAWKFKTPENQWEALFLSHVPRWLTVSDQASLAHYYQGGSSLYSPANFRPWIVPILCWSAFGTAMIFTMICLSSILRKHWVESEKLTFPIIQLPLEMTSEDGALFRNRLMWIGFAIAGSLTLLAGLHHLYPFVPALRIVRQNFGQYIVSPPWNAIGGLSVGFYFFAIGLAFLMPLDLSFSCWFFFILFKLQLVLCAATGWNELKVPGAGLDRGFPFPYAQSLGAYTGMFVMIVWTSRYYLRSVVRTAFTRHKELDDSTEAVSYRFAIIGALLGMIFLGVFAKSMGMSLLVIVAFFGIYFALAVMVSRIRAELGMPVHDMHVMGPQNAILAATGTQDLGVKNLMGFSLFYWFTRTYASHPMPHTLEGYKIAEKTNAPARQMFCAMCVAAAIAMPIGFWMLLHNYYHLGAGTSKMEIWALAMGNEAWGALADRLKNPAPYNQPAMLFVVIGFVISLAMAWMRRMFAWFPFHPLAYAAADSWGVAQLWVPLMIGSICKAITLRYSGLSGYRRILPFFFGLILGEIVIGSLWTLVGIALGIPTYDFWPGKY